MLETPGESSRSDKYGSSSGDLHIIVKNTKTDQGQRTFYLLEEKEVEYLAAWLSSPVLEIEFSLPHLK